jgi:hypothetical protein
MLDLDSPEWRLLRTPSGDARNIPPLIRSFWLESGSDAFDCFFSELVGDGYIELCDSFYAALPHATRMVQRLHGVDAEAALAKLGWAIALCGEEGGSPPGHLAMDFGVAVREVATMAKSMLRRRDSLEHRAWIVAALAAARGRHDRALCIIDNI